MTGTEFTAELYGEKLADEYDKLGGCPGDTAAAVEFLAALAGSGCALELGVGTGRIAIPLAARGVAVDGIDVSESMVRNAHAKAGAADVNVSVADFRSLAGVAGKYDVIYCVFNTFHALLDQDDQVQCVAACAAHLRPGGRLVIEAENMDMRLYDHGQRMHAWEIEPDRLVFSANRWDPVRQQIEIQRVILAEDGIKLFPWKIRYVWPSELDLMARLAGLRLEGRWQDWSRTEFTGRSFNHVSVYRPA